MIARAKNLEIPRWRNKKTFELCILTEFWSDFSVKNSGSAVCLRLPRLGWLTRELVQALHGKLKNHSPGPLRVQDQRQNSVILRATYRNALCTRAGERNRTCAWRATEHHSLGVNKLYSRRCLVRPAHRSSPSTERGLKLNTGYLEGHHIDRWLLDARPDPPQVWCVRYERWGRCLPRRRRRRSRSLCKTELLFRV